MSRINQPPSRPAGGDPSVHQGPPGPQGPAHRGPQPPAAEPRLPDAPLPGASGEPAGAAPRPGGAGPADAAARAAAAAAGGAVQPAGPKRLSAADAERIAAQSGFARGALKRRRPGLDMDEMSQSPIPLPVDEVDASAWEQGTLDSAQEQLTLQGHHAEVLAAVAGGAGDLDRAGVERLIAAVFTPTQADIQRLQALADRPESPEGPTLGDTLDSLRSLFGLGLDALPPGVARLAATLVVGGRSAHVAPQGESLAAEPLAAGVGGTISASNKAVSDARGMHEGIAVQLAHQRTRIPTR